jgi:hypothetical protein
MPHLSVKVCLINYPSIIERSIKVPRVVISKPFKQVADSCTTYFVGSGMLWRPVVVSALSH